MAKLNNDGWKNASITEEGENISSIRTRLLEHKVDRKEILTWNVTIISICIAITSYMLGGLRESVRNDKEKVKEHLVILKESNSLLRADILKQDQKLEKQDEALDKQKDLIHELDLEIKLLNERLKK
jgi:cell division protein FtsB